MTGTNDSVFPSDRIKGLGRNRFCLRVFWRQNNPHKVGNYWPTIEGFPTLYSRLPSLLFESTCLMLIFRVIFRSLSYCNLRLATSWFCSPGGIFFELLNLQPTELALGNGKHYFREIVRIIITSCLLVLMAANPNFVVKVRCRKQPTSRKE